MKNLTLVAFAVMMLLGWTGIAAGVLAGFAGHPSVSTPPHVHVEPATEVPTEPMLLSETPCDATALDASAGCST